MYNFQYTEVDFPLMGIIPSNLIQAWSSWGKTTFIYCVYGGCVNIFTFKLRMLKNSM